MTTFRVTVGASSYRSLANLQAAAARLANLQNQLSSGQQINKPSDDPTGTVRALQLRGDLKRSAQYASNASDALGFMTAADSAYQQATKIVQSARTLVVQGLNAGASDSASAAALADQVDALRSSLISVANASYNGRPVFGGTTAGAVAYDPSGTYVGDGGSVTRSVAPNTTVAISQTGTDAFGPPGNDLFALLDNVSAALRTDPSSLSSALTQFDGAIDRLGGAQAREGATYQQVQAASSQLSTTDVALKTELSSVQDIDLAQVAVQMTTASTTYQAALQTTANIRQLSLLQFLS
jgi:flagellar hook-associated protein 3 FlgL